MRTVEALIVIIGVCAALEFICARFGHGIQDAAAKAAETHVVWRHGNLYLRYCIHRHGVGVRQTAVGARCRETVHVAVGHAVYHERVVTVVDAAVRHASVLCGHGFGHEPHDVVERTRHRGYQFDGLLVEFGQHVGILARRGGDDDGIEHRVLLHGYVLHARIAHVQHHVVYKVGFVSDVVHLQTVSVVGAYAVNRVVAFGVGGDGVDRTGDGMREGDYGTCKNLIR